MFSVQTFTVDVVVTCTANEMIYRLRSDWTSFVAATLRERLHVGWDWRGVRVRVEVAAASTERPIHDVRLLTVDNAAHPDV